MADLRILDGGLATELEHAGHDLSGALWSAAILRDAPEAVAAVHDSYFAAGAEVATTATYQLSGMSLRAAGHSPRELEPLCARAAQLAADSRDRLAPDGLVAGSVGPYGASRADGSEYTGDYGLGNGPDAIRILREFHRPRLEALISAEVDVLACETLPCLVELEALVAEVTRLGVVIPVWFSFSTAPGGRTRTGEPLADAVAIAANLPAVMGLGVNCCALQDVLAGLEALGTRYPGVAYPGSGQTWDNASHTWQGQPSWNDSVVASWVAAGARLIGGCCQVGPEQISRLAQQLRSQ